MLPTQGVASIFAAPHIHTASFVLTDYLPAGVVALVLVALATALVLSVRRRKTD